LGWVGGASVFFSPLAPISIVQICSTATTSPSAGVYADRVLLESHDGEPLPGGHKRRRRAVGVLALAGPAAAPLRLAIQVGGWAGWRCWLLHEISCCPTASWLTLHAQTTGATEAHLCSM
jgi:hypothetical protein